MVEAIDIAPRLHTVTGLAAKGRSIGALASHLFVEFALVRVLVASGAGAILEMKGKDFVGATGQPHFVAIGAGHGRMSSGKREAGLAMFGDGVSGAVPIHHGVAIFAAIFVRSLRELIVVSVLVAVGTLSELHFVNGVLASGDVALVALDLDVFALQGVLRSVVFFHTESRRFTAVNIVACGAFALFGAGIELTLVGIRCVAVLAIGKGYFFFEVVLDVTGG